MSQFSNVVKKASARYVGRFPGRSGHHGGAKNSPDVVRMPRAGRGPRGRSADLADDIIKKWGGQVAKMEPGRQFDALTESFVAEPKVTKIQRLKQILTGSGAKRLGLYGLGAAGVVGAVAGIDALRNALDKRVGKEKAFKNMIKDNPSLASADPEHVRKVFGTLYTFNKDMAKDPLVAGSFTRRSLMFKDEGIQPMDVKTLTEIRKNMRDSKGGGSRVRDAVGDLGTIGGLARFAG